jgi:hypothetical protein
MIIRHRMRNTRFAAAALDVHPSAAMQNPAAQSDCYHDGGLHPGLFGRHPRGALEARAGAQRGGYAILRGFLTTVFTTRA